MYIRTKDDEIYDLESKGVSSWKYIDNDTARDIYGVDGAFYTIYYFDENKGRYSEYDDKGGHSCDFIEEKDILKQSENIEELCDEFVDDNQHYIIQNPNILKSIKRNECLKDHNIYGAIWCEFGLKYVAKMDSDGKLVLI